jgi:hypothetical protein
MGFALEHASSQQTGTPADDLDAVVARALREAIGPSVEAEPPE